MRYIITEELEVSGGVATAEAYVDANSKEEAIEKYKKGESHDYEINYDTDNERLSIEAELLKRQPTKDKIYYYYNNRIEALFVAMRFGIKFYCTYIYEGNVETYDLMHEHFENLEFEMWGDLIPIAESNFPIIVEEESVEKLEGFLNEGKLEVKPLKMSQKDLDKSLADLNFDYVYSEGEDENFYRR